MLALYTDSLFLFFSAQCYPKAILSRSVNYESKDMLAYVSF